MNRHIPVLLNEVIQYLEPRAGENFIDATYGGGGHSQAIWERIKPTGHILGIDADKEAISNFKFQISNFKLVHDNFVNLKEIYEQHFPYPISGILFDLGLSSVELDSSGRGFSFRFDEPLDMRFDVSKQRLTAAEVLNKYGAQALLRIFVEYGEISKLKAKRVIAAILKIRGKQKFETTYDLVKIILLSLYPDLAEQGDKLNLIKPFKSKRRAIHPATQFFQAVRIEVNNELNNLSQALPQAWEILETGGRLAVISFHSLEDRIVKNYFRDWAREGRAELLVKKPLMAEKKELEDNPRARSAKLRAIRKL